MKEPFPEKKRNRPAPRARLACLCLAATGIASCSTHRTYPMKTQSDTAPKLLLSNESLDLEIWLPDPEKGFYRGVRFDWSGMINQIRYNGHTFLACADYAHLADGGCGTAEEFGIGAAGTPVPPGYETARPGEPFLKIGVGMLQKESDEPYSFRHPYPLIEPGTWSVRSGPDWVEFVHELPEVAGWAYRYTKRISLVPGTAGMRIERHLENRGLHPIETTHYGHHFLLFDKQPVGPGYRVILPDGIRHDTGDFKSFSRLYNGVVEWTAPMRGDDVLFTTFEVDGKPRPGYRLTVHNEATGTAVDISGTPGICRLHLFARSVMLCPEPFVVLSIAPGETFSWQTHYAFRIH